ELDRDAAAAEGGRGRDRLDAGDARHRALDHGGQLAVDGFGRGAGKGGGDGDDRAVDVGQFADLDAEEGGEARHRDQHVEHQSQDRPAHEQRGQAVFGAVHGRGLAHRARLPQVPVTAAVGMPPVSRLTTRTGAPSRTAWMPSVTTVPPVPSSPAISTLFVLRWMMRTSTRRASPSSITQTKAPSGPHWTDSGLTDG